MLSGIIQNTAVITAAVAVLTWILNRLYGLAANRHEKARDRRLALLQFQTDLTLRAEGLVGLDDPNYAQSIIAMMREHAARGAAFRIYGVQVTDTRSQERVESHIDTLPSETIYLIKKVVLLDRLMVAEYEKMQTDAFENLTIDRQIAVFEKWISGAMALSDTIREFEAETQTWPKAWRLSKFSGRERSQRKDDRTHDAP